MTYASTFKTDPITGGVLFLGNGRIESVSPQVERVLFVLRTERGRCLADPDIGVEWSRVSKLGTGAADTAKAAITAALRFMVEESAITDLVVTADVDVSRGLLVYDVAFTDPRLDRRVRIRGSL